MIRLKTKEHANGDIRVSGHFHETNTYEVLQTVAYLIKEVHKNHKDLSDKEIYKNIKEMVKEWEIMENLGGNDDTDSTK